MSGVPPAFVLFAAALALPLLPLTARRGLTVAAPLLALPLMYALPEGTSWTTSGFHFAFFWARSDSLSRLFGLAFLGTTAAANLYGWRRERAGEQAAGLIYAGGGLAVVFAGDLITLLFAWEITAVASTFVIAAGRGRAALAAAQRYLMVHLASGAVLLVGALLLGGSAGSPAFDDLRGQGWASWLILAAFCVNAAVPPLHAWLPDAYPESTPAGSVLLSAFTTKAAVYCLLRGFPGEPVLVWVGAAMAVYGIAYAVLENDIRRLLSYHIVSQVGYMVCGIGIGSALAMNGAAAHALNNLLYKTLLFMAAGAVLEVTGTQKLTQLGGLARAMPWTLAFYVIGALAISGLPPLNGFVSKLMVINAAGEAHLAGPALLLELASVGTFLSVGLKLPWFAWFGEPRHDARSTVHEAPAPMLAAMAALSLFCVALGVAPGWLLSLLPFEAEYQAYTWPRVLAMLLVTASTAAVFVWLRHRLRPHAAITLDTDWFYRQPAAVFVARVCEPLFGLYQRLGAAAQGLVDRIVAAPRRLDPERRPPIGAIVLWILAVFAIAGWSFIAAAR